MIIDSPYNPTVKALRSLELPKNIRARKQFLVEGVRAVEDGLAAGRLPDLCLYSPELLKRTERGTKLLKLLETRLSGKLGNRAISEATPRALAAASQTQHPQGVVSAFPLIEWLPQEAQKGLSPLLLVCDNIQDPGNLGTILRTAEAAGVRAVYLSPDCVDQYNPKVVRAATGSHFRLPIYSQSWPEIEQSLKMLGVSKAMVFATDAEATRVYDEIDWTQPTALIVSNEAHGMTSEADQLAGNGANMIAIPMSGGTESLNAAVSVSVILFEAARQRRVAHRL